MYQIITLSLEFEVFMAVWCCSGLLHHVVFWLCASISKEHTAFIFGSELEHFNIQRACKASDLVLEAQCIPVARNTHWHNNDRWYVKICSVTKNKEIRTNRCLCEWKIASVIKSIHN
jgi:hypothetical protein